MRLTISAKPMGNVFARLHTEQKFAMLKRVTWNYVPLDRVSIAKLG
jgi:hypothetical protein